MTVSTKIKRMIAAKAKTQALRQRKGNQGFSLLELTLALFILALVLGLLAQFFLTSSRSAVNIRSSVGIQVGAQYGMDLLSQDIDGADLCLASYTNGSTTYASSTNGTLVLRTPAVTSAGTAIVANVEDHIVYQLVATAAGAANGPYTLNRTVIPGAGSGRTAVSNQVVTNNVTSASFTYIAAQTQTQNALGSLKIFLLIDGAVYAAPVGSTAVQQAIVAGVDQCSGASACYSGTTLTLTSAAAANAPMDLRFSVDPTITVSIPLLTGCGVNCASGETANFAKEVMVTMTVTGGAGTGNTLSQAAPNTTLTTTASLRNKVAF